MSTSKKSAKQPHGTVDPAERTVDRLFARVRAFAPKIITDAGVFNLGSDEAYAAFEALGFPAEDRAYQLLHRVTINDAKIAIALSDAIGEAAIEARDSGYALGLAVGLDLAKGQIGGAR
jgi:hypothetical protein